jgi:hypothetical protein
MKLNHRFGVELMAIEAYVCGTKAISNIPNISHLCLFKLCFFCSCTKEKTRLNFKCILIGYNEETKEYKLYNPAS